MNGKDYPAYSFWNKSEDIRTLFIWACQLAGVNTRQSNAYNVSIARRPDVATLDVQLSRPAFEPWGWLAHEPAFLGRTAAGKVS